MPHKTLKKCYKKHEKHISRLVVWSLYVAVIIGLLAAYRFVLGG